MDNGPNMFVAYLALFQVRARQSVLLRDAEIARLTREATASKATRGRGALGWLGALFSGLGLGSSLR